MWSGQNAEASETGSIESGYESERIHGGVCGGTPRCRGEEAGIVKMGSLAIIERQALHP